MGIYVINKILLCYYVNIRFFEICNVDWFIFNELIEIIWLFNKIYKIFLKKKEMCLLRLYWFFVVILIIFMNFKDVGKMYLLWYVKNFIYEKVLR